jgi:hypothetical protein
MAGACQSKLTTRSELSSITLDTLGLLNAQSPGPGTGRNPGRTGVGRLPAVPYNLITARTAFWKRTHGSRTSRKRWVSCLCLWLLKNQGIHSLEMNGMHAVLPSSTSLSVAVIMAFSALTLGRRVAANHASLRKRVRHRLHHCIASRSRVLEPLLVLVREGCPSLQYEGPEMEMRPDDVTSRQEQKSNRASETLEDTNRTGQTYRHNNDDHRRQGF